MTPPAFTVRTLHLDLPAVAAAFGRRLHEAGVDTTADRAVRFARALELGRPVSRGRLYWLARGVFVTDRAQVRAFDGVFAEVFGADERHTGMGTDFESVPIPEEETQPDRPAGRSRDERGIAGSGDRTAGPPGEGDDEDLRDVVVPVAASDEEVLREKRFDALSPGELATLYRLMERLEVATPTRRTRRSERDRHGSRIDMRRTLRGSARTAGDPFRLARRRRRVARRRMVLLCDISGSMEPYARAYLQFLTCAAGSARDAEAFVFATRLTRVTRALRSRSPERAIQRAAAAAPDWSSGTRIGDALREFNDRHGRRGMARGAVVVILSDGWERGEPALVAREMQRLSRLAHRIVWVNPRVAASGFSPRAGGMAAAMPHCDALVSGHSLEAMGEVIEAIGAELGARRMGTDFESVPIPEAEEAWASATPVPGSSVAMPSGYGPSRGRTTPGWGLDGGE
ncbi:MAG TPA: VWA domain-containing protein [Thermoleophilaceae bacterium]